MYLDEMCCDAGVAVILSNCTYVSMRHVGRMNVCVETMRREIEHLKVYCFFGYIQSKLEF